MKLVKTKRRPRIKSMTENRRILEEFIGQEEEVMEVLDWVPKTAAGAAGSLNNSIKTYKMGGIRAISTNGHVYLIKIKD